LASVTAGANGPSAREDVFDLAGHLGEEHSGRKSPTAASNFGLRSKLLDVAQQWCPAVGRCDEQAAYRTYNLTVPSNQPRRELMLACGPPILGVFAITAPTIPTIEIHRVQAHQPGDAPASITERLGFEL
jgi:hypothetical protein